MPAIGAAALAVGFAAATGASVAAEQAGRSPALFDGQCEVRVYTINKGKMAEFVSAWRTGVYPLRLKHGFTIPAAWSVADSNQFMWIMCYAGAEGFQARDAAYYASSDRQTMKPDPRDFIARAEKWPMTPVVPER